MIDTLFGSKTRVKLLHLFFNNPGQSFYVREITRKIDEQINSVRRELSNMLEVGAITSDSSDNKLYYQVNQRYKYYVALRAIFADVPIENRNIDLKFENNSYEGYVSKINDIEGIRVAIFSGVLIKNSNSPIDIIVAGNVNLTKLKKLVRDIEKTEGREINYSVMSYDEFYYRQSVRDKFIMEILDNKHEVVIDKDHILLK